MRLLKRLARFTYVTDMMRGFVSKAASPQDVLTAKQEGRHCLYMTGNGVPLTQQWVSVPDELRYVRIFYQLGIRMMHLTYQRRNMIGDGCGEKTDAGLSDFGEAAIAEMTFLEAVQAHIDEGLPARTFEVPEEQAKTIAELHLLTMKPVLYVANVAEDGFEDNARFDAVNKVAAAEGAEVVAICNKLEAEIAELEADEKLDFLAEMGITEPGLDRVIRAGYKLLGLQTFFTAGPKEVRAWTVRQQASAPQAAGVIHTDFEKGFIRAEVVAYGDFVDLGGEPGAKEAGKWRLEGKEYQVADGDVIHFRFNV